MINTISNFSSPQKPRLLWRGTLHLPDGTALPGLAIISTITPGFERLRQRSQSGENTFIENAKEINLLNDLFTLPQIKQDELCLSLEMVRHSPLQILKVIDNDLIITENQDKKIISQGINIDENINNNTNSSFEIGGDIRLYIDPSELATLAFFKNLFRNDDDDEKNNSNLKLSKSAIIFSLDKSLIKNFEKIQNHEIDISCAISKELNFLKDNEINNDDIIEGVLLGIYKENNNDEKSDLPFIELHVGRKINKNRKSNLNQIISNQNSQKRSLRPDDPAPRDKISTSKNIFSKSLSMNSNKSLLIMQNENLKESNLPIRKRLKKSSTSKISIDSLENSTSSSITSTTIESIEQRNRSLIKKLVHYQLLGKGVERTDKLYSLTFNPTCQGTVLALRKFNLENQLLDKQQTANIIKSHLDMYI